MQHIAYSYFLCISFSVDVNIFSFFFSCTFRFGSILQHICLHFFFCFSRCRRSHMPQRSIFCTDASNETLCKIFSIFKKLLCERNFIFMTFFLLLSWFVCCARLHYIADITSLDTSVVFHTVVRSTYIKQIKLLKKDILIACIDDILTFPAPSSFYSTFSLSLSFPLSLSPHSLQYLGFRFLFKWQTLF